MKEYRIRSEDLGSFLTALFEKTGMPRDDAEYSSRCLVQTDLWGIESHGILRLPIYEERLAKKAVNPTPRIVERAPGDHAVAMIDGDAGLGYVVGRAAMRLAVKKAERYGVGLVLALNSNHFGAASLFNRIATDAGMIGLATTNVIPNIGMRGTRQPATGNNPVALSLPIPGRPPFSLDISMSAVAGGKLLLAAKKGEKIPLDWAVTKDGADTDDPKAGFDGFLLPMGMHKGFGMSLFIDAITGVLAGAPFLNGLKSMYKHPDEPSNTTHLFAAADPGFFCGRERFFAAMEEWVKLIRGVPMREGVEPLKIPGDIEAAKQEERERNGIPVPENLVGDLERIAKKYGLSLPAMA